jgi:hypothetical protein
MARWQLGRLSAPGTNAASRVTWMYAQLGCSVGYWSPLALQASKELGTLGCHASHALVHVPLEGRPASEGVGDWGEGLLVVVRSDEDAVAPRAVARPLFNSCSEA